MIEKNTKTKNLKNKNRKWGLLRDYKRELFIVMLSVVSILVTCGKVSVGVYIHVS